MADIQSHPVKSDTNPSKLYAVAIEHLPENCPLVQSTSADAKTLATNLTQNPTIGVFSMKLHHGVVLLRTSNLTTDLEVLNNALPKHLSPEAVEVTDQTILLDVFQDPSLLSSETNRHEVLAAAHELFPHTGFDQTKAQNKPSLPLHSETGPALPDYLRTESANLDNA